MRLIIAANRGPIRKTDDGWTPSVGGLATALLPVLEKQHGVWVSMNEKGELPARQAYPSDDPRIAVRRVPLSETELDHYYYGMANRVLWPVSHYMIQHLELNPDFYDDYEKVNTRFADAVVDEYERGDHIWIQDYHLMLAPQRIRQARPEATIAHFWHIPWPAMEMFRVLPWSRELIRGMLGCDLIGFHVEEYVENFIESARVLLGAEVDDRHVYWNGRQIRVEAHPLGVDVQRFQQMANSEVSRKRAQALRGEVGGEFLILGVDRLDYTKGILSRLLAFERFLQDNPTYQGKVTFYQVATPSRTKVPSYQQLKREVDEAVGRINGDFGKATWLPVHYRYRTYTQKQLSAFYRAADVALITPLRDGMNLVAQEYVAANDHGVLILSEMTGAAYLMPEALQVNPYDQEGLTHAIREALKMPAEEKQERLSTLKAKVADLDVHHWAERFLTSMAAPVA